MCVRKLRTWMNTVALNIFLGVYCSLYTFDPTQVG